MVYLKLVKLEIVPKKNLFDLQNFLKQIYINEFLVEVMLSEIIILLLAVPVGYLIAYWTRDELVQGRKWFKVLIVLAVLTGICFFLIGEKAMVWTSGFVFISTFVSLVKSRDKKWVGRKFKRY